MAVRLFNLDLHISVIADVKQILSTLYGDKIQIDSWSLSGHNWVLGNTPKTVKHITTDNWKSLKQKQIDDFLREYDSVLQHYDGFVVTHTPVLARLYEAFDKPIIMVNSCRYDQPYCWSNDLQEWDILNATLNSINEAGNLIAISNNLADQEYLSLGAGVASTHIPSLCEYTGVKHRPAWFRKVRVASDKLNCIPASCNIAPPLEKGYSWSKLYNQKGLVFVPYEVSTMTMFEAYSSGIPMVLPSNSFYKRIIEENPKLLSPTSGVYWDPAKLPTNLKQTAEIDWWIERADFYRTMPGINYFDSWEKLKNIELKDHKTNLASRRGHILESWCSLISAGFSNLNS